MLLRIASALLLLSLITRASLSMADDVTPVLRIKILMTALSFEKKLLKQSGRLHLAAYGACGTAAGLKLTQGKEVNGIPLTYEVLDEIKSKDQLAGWIKQHNANVLFVCDVPPASAEFIAEIAKEQKIIVLADNPDLVGNMAVLAVANKDGRPRLMLNITKAKEVGAEFDGRIFGVATIVH